MIWQGREKKISWFRILLVQNDVTTSFPRVFSIYNVFYVCNKYVVNLQCFYKIFARNDSERGTKKQLLFLLSLELNCSYESQFKNSFNGNLQMIVKRCLDGKLSVYYQKNVEKYRTQLNAKSDLFI